MDRITNLNFVKEADIICNGEGTYYAVHNIDHHASGSRTLTLIEFNEFFTMHQVTLPAACNADYKFISEKDNNFEYVFFTPKLRLYHLSQAINKWINEQHSLRETQYKP